MLLTLPGAASTPVTGATTGRLLPLGIDLQETVSNAFGRLPDQVLLPWLPNLIVTLRSGGAEMAPLLIREAGRIFPGRLPELDEWVPPWRIQPEPETANTAQGMNAGQRITPLAAHPATRDAVAVLLGCDGTWDAADPGVPGAALADRYQDIARELEVLLAGLMSLAGPGWFGMPGWLGTAAGWRRDVWCRRGGAAGRSGAAG
jgi:hypothetical protein